MGAIANPTITAFGGLAEYRGGGKKTKHQCAVSKEALQKPSASDRDIIRSGVDWRA
jgi:hypothetical protein